MTIPANYLRAAFTPKTEKTTGKRFVVHFNPSSLSYTITNTMKEQGQGNTNKQYVSQSTGKLTMDLIYDSTDSGKDVRVFTSEVAKLMEPDAKTHIPPIVLFEWGVYKFEGMMESYKETLDFFAANGVPLRASINLTLSRQDKVFDSGANQDGAPPPEAVEVPGGPATTATSMATQAGNPNAGRSIAAANNLESMRFTAGAAMTVGGGVELGGPVAFATGGAGLSLGAGGGAGLGGGAGFGASAGFGAGASFGASASAGASFGAGASAGFGAGASAEAGAGFGASAGFGGASAGFEASASASAGFSLDGEGFSASASASASASTMMGGVVTGSASAGVAATEGAFAGLHVEKSTSFTSTSLDTTRLVETSQSFSFATDRGADFSVGGQATIEGSASMSADVGATSLSALAHTV